MLTLCVIGCGLLGSSVALAAKHHLLFDKVVGVDQSSTNLKQAIDLGIIDGEPDDYSEIGAVCIAVPTQHIATHVREIASVVDTDIPIFDVGSVKGSIFRELEQVPPNFVACHPIAGSHLSGPSVARKDLFVGSVCVVTPTESTNVDLQDFVVSLWRSLGARVVFMSPVAHDRALMLTSHLPHLISCAAVKQLIEDGSVTSDAIGPGFRDFSRISAGDAIVWRNIFANNLDELRNGFQELSSLVDHMIGLIESDPEGLERLLRQIASFRDGIDGK